MCIHQRLIQNPVEHIRWSFLRNSSRLSAVNYFCKKLHVRCSTGFWIRLCTNSCETPFSAINLKQCVSLVSTEIYKGHKGRVKLPLAFCWELFPRKLDLFVYQEEIRLHLLENWPLIATGFRDQIVIEFCRNLQIHLLLWF